MPLRVVWIVDFMPFSVACGNALPDTVASSTSETAESMLPDFVSAAWMTGNAASTSACGLPAVRSAAAVCATDAESLAS